MSAFWSGIEVWEGPSNSGLGPRKSSGPPSRERESWILVSFVLRVIRAFRLGGGEEDIVSRSNYVQTCRVEVADMTQHDAAACCLRESG